MNWHRIRVVRTPSRLKILYSNRYITPNQILIIRKIVTQTVFGKFGNDEYDFEMLKVSQNNDVSK